MEIKLHSQHNKLIKLLGSNFINSDQGLLETIYKEFVEFSKTDNIDEIVQRKGNLSFADLSNLNPSFLEIVNKVNETHKALSYASDLPIFIECKDNKNADTIMICAMDSLPPEPNYKNLRDHPVYKNRKKGYDPKLKIGFWAPFSLIENNNDENFLFFNELIKYYNIYVTDIYKLFFYIDINKTNENGKQIFKKSNALNNYRKLKAHANILAEEIEIVNPKCIITMGNNASNALLMTENKKIAKWEDCNETGGLQINEWGKKTDTKLPIKIISIPHISGAANGAKSLIIENQLHKNIAGKNIIKYANIVLHELNKIA